MPDLASSLLSGKLTYALAHLRSLPRAAVVVEDRYSQLFKLEHVRGASAAEALAEAQARFPSIPTVFCESRPLAQEWTYRWLGACVAELSAGEDTEGLEDTFAPGEPVPERAATAAEIRAWALAQGHAISSHGKIMAAVREAYEQRPR